MPADSPQHVSNVTCPSRRGDPTPSQPGPGQPIPGRAACPACLGVQGAAWAAVHAALAQKDPSCIAAKPLSNFGLGNLGAMRLRANKPRNTSRRRALPSDQRPLRNGEWGMGEPIPVRRPAPACLSCCARRDSEDFDGPIPRHDAVVGVVCNYFYLPSRSSAATVLARRPRVCVQ